MLKLTFFLPRQPTGHGQGSALDVPLLALPGYAQRSLGRGDSAHTL
jgi:hypothetical protein